MNKPTASDPADKTKQVEQFYPRFGEMICQPFRSFSKREGEFAKTGEQVPA